MANNWKGVQPGDASQAGLLGIPDYVNVVKGSTAIVLVKPADAKILVVKAVAGNWYLRSAAAGTAQAPTAATMPAAYPSGTAKTDGTGAWPLAEGETLAIPSYGWVTVKGYAAGDELSYYWI